MLYTVPSLPGIKSLQDTVGQTSLNLSVLLTPAWKKTRVTCKGQWQLKILSSQQKVRLKLEVTITRQVLPYDQSHGD
jgi:hypothetical protein